uniref:Si:ch211-263p13.7 n=1 Tax=Scleropages formosus TaxID=113540 RepID=A0A8C9SBA3_SCLFO
RLTRMTPETLGHCSCCRTEELAGRASLVWPLVLWGHRLSPCSVGDELRDRRPQSAVLGQEGHAGGTRGCCQRCPLRIFRKAVLGLVLGSCVALSWAGSTHTAKLALQRLQAPFLITWFCCTWNLLSFPLCYLGHLAGPEKKQWPMSRFRHCSKFLGEERLTARVVLRGAAPFSALWNVSMYLYLLALRHISASDASAVLCCSQAFAFLLSWIGLKDTFMGVRIVGVILSITGIVMMAYADGFHSDSITGVALGVGSASTAALYQVLLRKRVGEVQPGTASVLLSCVGLCSLVFHSWLCALLYLTHVESWPPARNMPWEMLCALAALLLAFNIIVNLGSVLTYPTLISLGVLLSVPANTAADVYLTATSHVSEVRIAAAGIIGAGYLLLLLPEHWDDSARRWLGALLHGKWREDGLPGDEGAGDGGTACRTKAKPASAATLP